MSAGEELFPDRKAAAGRRRLAIALVVMTVALLLVAVTRFAGGDGEGDGGGGGGDGGGGDSLPLVDLTGADGAAVSTSTMIGTPLVINFWYSACAPCANELRDFAAVDARYGEEVRFVGVNAIDSIDEMESFAGERGVTYTLFQDRLAELQTELRLASFPTTIFVDADGRIVERTGVLDESALADAVDQLLAVEVE